MIVPVGDVDPGGSRRYRDSVTADTDLLRKCKVSSRQKLTLSVAKASGSSQSEDDASSRRLPKDN